MIDHKALYEYHRRGALLRLAQAQQELSTSLHHVEFLDAGQQTSDELLPDITEIRQIAERIARAPQPNQIRQEAA